MNFIATVQVRSGPLAFRRTELVVVKARNWYHAQRLAHIEAGKLRGQLMQLESCGGKPEWVDSGVAVR